MTAKKAYVVMVLTCALAAHTLCAMEEDDPDLESAWRAFDRYQSRSDLDLSLRVSAAELSRYFDEGAASLARAATRILTDAEPMVTSRMPGAGEALDEPVFRDLSRHEERLRELYQAAIQDHSIPDLSRVRREANVKLMDCWETTILIHGSRGSQYYLAAARRIEEIVRHELAGYQAAIYQKSSKFSEKDKQRLIFREAWHRAYLQIVFARIVKRASEHDFDTLYYAARRCRGQAEAWRRHEREELRKEARTYLEYSAAAWQALATRSRQEPNFATDKKAIPYLEQQLKECRARLDVKSRD